MVRLLAVNQLDVKIRPEGIAKRPTKFLHEDDIEIAHKHRRGVRLINQMRATTDIDDDAGQRFVHRENKKTVTLDPDLVAERLFEGLPEHEPHILDRVVVVDLDVALGLHRQVEEPVLREEREHVVEEGHASGDFRPAATVDCQGQRDVRLRRFTEDRRYAFVVFSHASRVSLRTSISSSVPTLIRRNGAVKACFGKWRTRTLWAKRKS